MKKLKVLLSVVLTCVLALSLAGCASNCGGETTTTEDVIELVLIKTDTSNAKTEFFIGDEFSTEGLVVTSTTRNRTQGTVSYDAPVDLADCTIDSSAYKADTVGTYTINVSYTLGEITKTADYSVEVVRDIRPSRLVLDDSEVQKSFNVNDEFTYAGLKATVFDYNYKTNTELEGRDVSSEITVDSSAYKKDAQGEYTINVSYTQYETTINSSYVVIVKLGAGLAFDVPSDISGFTSDEYGRLTTTLGTDGTTIDFSSWKVNAVDANGVVESDVTDKVAFSAYLNNTPVTVTDKQIQAEKAGAYNIVAKLDDYTIPGTEEVVDLSAFVIVYVTDALDAQLTLVTEGAVLTQEQGTDEISSTWNFTAKYASGATKTISSKEVDIEGLNTNQVTDNGVATVTYIEENCKGETMTATCEVKYTITERQAALAGTAGISFEDLTFGTGDITGEYDPALHGSLTIDDENDLLLSSTVINTSTNNFGVRDVPATITTRTGEEINLTKALYTRGGSRTNRRAIQFVLPDEGVEYTIRVWASVDSADQLNRHVAYYNGAVSGNYANLAALGDQLTTTPSVRELTNVGGGTWYIGGDASIYIHYIEIIATSTESHGQTYSIDFTDTAKIAANDQLAGSTEEGLVAIKNIEGADTGFSVTKCGTSGKYTQIGTQNSKQCLITQGTGTAEKNSIAVKVAAGKVTVTMKYFQNKDGRYLKILNDGLDTVVPTDPSELTAATDKNTRERTVTFTLDEETTLYIGSATGGGLYIESIVITVE